MADWYCSSAAYAAIAAFTASHAYSIGDVVKPTAPALKAQWAFRCTTAGTSSTEPTWPTADGSTVTTGGATFTNVTGESAYFWTAAAGDLATLITTNARVLGGDRVFLSSDHTETQTTLTNYGTGNSGVSSSFGVIQFLCVNRSGSTPPAPADLTTGAIVAVNTTNPMRFFSDSPCFHHGITFKVLANSAFNTFEFDINAQNQTLQFESCLFLLGQSSAASHFGTNAAAGKIILDNTQFNFGNVSEYIGSGSSGIAWDLVWRNTANAIQGTAPSTLFNLQATSGQTTCRGLDLSAVTGTLVRNSAGNGHKFLFDSCKIASAVTRFSTSSIANCVDEVELVNCYDGTHFLSERYQAAGTVTTEFSTTLSGGAADDVGNYSHKLVSSTNVDKFANRLNSFWMDVENTVTGSSKTATVEIISSGTLNNDEISLLLEYQGTSGSSLSSFASSFIATPMTTPSALPTSSNTWNNPPSTPVKQLLQVTFTPQVAGRVRGLVQLGKASTTVWVNPQISIA